MLIVNIICMIGLGLHLHSRPNLGIGNYIRFHSQFHSRNYNYILLFCDLELTIGFVFRF